MKKLKVLTVVGTRPEIIRLSAVIKKLDLHCNHTLVHTGQNYDYELNEIFFNDLGIKKPKIFLGSAAKNASKTIGNIISDIDDVLMKVKPDAFLVLGDTNSCLSAITAKRHKVPIFHMEAGNRCFDQRVPEEINRKIVDNVSDINMTYSSIAREHLISEGFLPNRVIKTGSPMNEVLLSAQNGIERSDVLAKLKLEKNNYYVVSAHREENVDNFENLNKLVKSLNQLSTDTKKPIIFSTHPRTKNMLKKHKLKVLDGVKLCKPFGFFDYICLQKNSKAVLSDSGTIFEESSILKFPALCIREAHERPEAMEECPVIMSGLEYDRIRQSLNLLEKSNTTLNKIVDDYSPNNVSDKVVRIIHSYVDSIRRFVWHEHI